MFALDDDAPPRKLQNILSRLSRRFFPRSPPKMATMTAGDAQLFEEQFEISHYDQSKYDRVARITAASQDNSTHMTLDVNIELFPCQVRDQLTVVLATSLSLDGKTAGVGDDKGWRDVKGESTLADMYDYVCHGKIYKFEDGSDGQSL